MAFTTLPSLPSDQFIGCRADMWPSMATTRSLSEDLPSVLDALTMKPSESAVAAVPVDDCCVPVSPPLEPPQPTRPRPSSAAPAAEPFRKALRLTPRFSFLCMTKSPFAL